MQFVTYKQLVDDVREFSHTIGPIWAVVGIPRSGMIAASIFAQFNGCLLGSLYSLGQGQLYESGLGRISREPRKEIVILDDSCYAGQAMRKATNRVLLPEQPWEYLSPDFVYSFGAIYGSEESLPLLDYYHKVIEGPRLFEWNWLRHKRMEETIFDMDGVLCDNPPHMEDDNNPEQFLHHLLYAKPLHIPHRQVMKVVTGRLNKYRNTTIGWLQYHKVSFGELVMCDKPTALARRMEGGTALMKGINYRDSTATLFVESSSQEARIIAGVSRKPVLCTENWEVYP